MESESSKRNTAKDDKKSYLLNFLKESLPSRTRTEISTLSDCNFAFTTSAPKKEKTVRKKKQFITRKERKKLNILKLPKQDWNYKELGVMRDLWKQYMRNNLALYPKIPTWEDSNWNNFNITLAKSEFIGAELTVVRSKNVNQVGMRGIVVLETKATYQIVTPKNELKILIKKSSVFSLVLDDMKFTIFGKYTVVRPSERSIKKVKTLLLPDL
ncbi:hypothetical protein PPYR_03600 [Photinus pyralis]|uniref:Ribonuclease P protein subunit p29 n=2 Tax=Photinus pyralis TaxID=7054 RepID=A0A5N4A396_PHOPY|nr:ribonuclease P protein subunit p29 [Photinus pyralis]KAB0791800.1 hypothetical protein PPYR_03600 [Photinus pyralis]